MRAGPLDRRITILRKSITLSPSGESMETWRVLSPKAPNQRGWARISASIIPLRGEEKSTAAQYVAMEQSSIQIRWARVFADLSPLDRVVYPGIQDEEVEGSPPEIVLESEINERRLYDIIAVHETDRRETLTIQAARRVDPVTIESPSSPP